MTVKIYDTLSEQKIELKKSPRLIKMFVCGPTVYDLAHLGHAKMEISFDIIARYLRGLGYNIFYLQNITDVDDKIINRSRDEKVLPQQLARRFEKEYLNDMKVLRIASVDKRVRASDFIEEIQNQIKRLIGKELAYKTSSGVYFEVRKFKDYGKLSKQNLEELRSGWRIEPDPEKKDPMDFALWKFNKEEEGLDWNSPWGRGRPGWHIEDTAITEKLLGPQYDIHGGGVDLKFPHHESEIAQQESVSEKIPFVKIWMHAGFLLVNGEKMAKSLGNFVTVREFLQKHSANILRFAVTASHYRSPINYSDHLVEQANNSLRTIEDFLNKLDLVKSGGEINKPLKNYLVKSEKEFAGAMNDDFNTPEALAVVFRLINEYQEGLWHLNKNEAEAIKLFIIKKLNIFGIIFKKSTIPRQIKLLVKQREALRKNKKFNEADMLREKIEAMGYSLEDTPAGPLVSKTKAL